MQTEAASPTFRSTSPNSGDNCLQCNHGQITANCSFRRHRPRRDGVEAIFGTNAKGPGSDGYAEFTVPADGGYVFFGLSHGDIGQGYTEIDYAFYPHPGLRLVVIYEKGEYIGSFGAVAPGTKLRISVKAGGVHYWRDGVLLRTSPLAPTYPLRVDTSLYSTGATIQAVTLAGVTLIDTP